MTGREQARENWHDRARGQGKDYRPFHLEVCRTRKFNRPNASISVFPSGFLARPECPDFDLEPTEPPLFVGSDRATGDAKGSRRTQDRAASRNVGPTGARSIHPLRIA